MTSTARAIQEVVPEQPRVSARARARPARLRYTIYAISAAVWVCLFYYGLPYYRLGLAERLHSSAHRALRPVGELGLLYGYIGTAFVLLLFLYSIRKRVRALARLGSLGRWLNVHIFCGVAGPAMITLHSSLKVTGAIAVGYWAMVGVMLSGFVGYYLLRQVGGALAEADEEAESLARELEDLDRELVERYGFLPADLDALRRRSGADRAERMGALQSLFYLMGQDFLGFLDALGLIRRHGALRRLGRIEARRVRAMTRRRMLVERRRAFLRQTGALFHYWHAIHRPFTIVLFLMVGLHIGIAVWLGYAVPHR